MKAAHQVPRSVTHHLRNRSASKASFQEKPNGERPKARRHTSDSTHGPLPVLELFQKENCPFSHAVRSKLTRLGLDFVAHSVPDGHPPSSIEQLVRAGGKDQLPLFGRPLERGQALRHRGHPPLSRDDLWRTGPGRPWLGLTANGKISEEMLRAALTRSHGRVSPDRFSEPSSLSLSSSVPCALRRNRRTKDRQAHPRRHGSGRGRGGRNARPAGITGIHRYPKRDRSGLAPLRSRRSSARAKLRERKAD